MGINLFVYDGMDRKKNPIKHSPISESPPKKSNHGSLQQWNCWFAFFCESRSVKVRCPLVISASGSLDLVDLHGVGRPNWFKKGPAKATVASATTQFHWQDQSLNKESNRGEEPSACFSVLGIAGSSPGRTSHPNLPTAFLTVQPLQGWPRRSIASGHPKKRKKKEVWNV